jgi:acetyl esterase/lipase
MNIKIFSSLAFFCIALTSTSCAFKRIKRSKNITYQQPIRAGKIAAQQLSVFAPRVHKDHRNVLIFIHGGNWNSGRKSLYNFFGSRLARKGVVAVIIDYPLSPAANANDMAKASARAVEWTKNNITKFGGDPDRIFVSGHSAGGELAALIAIRSDYFDSLGIKNPLKGVVLIDAAGLDMYSYLKETRFPPDHTYYKTFTTNPTFWREMSPLYYLHNHMPPLLIYRGEKTYPMIAKSNDKFLDVLKTEVPVPDYHFLKGKKHVPMITQFLWSWNPHYQEIIDFMNNN